MEDISRVLGVGEVREMKYITCFGSRATPGVGKS